jgi:quinoprotein glucose dehydrogenase
MPNKADNFPGIVEHDGFDASIWVKFPFVENPGSIGIDRKGRIFVAEANRFWLGVPDLRGANELIPGDFQAMTVEDRAKLYEKFRDRFPKDFFTSTADRIIRLEDRDGNGAADHRTLFSDHFRDPLDGIGFSILPEDDAVYFTCIPKVWKLTDPDDDGVADKHGSIAEGFGVRVSFIGHDLHGIIRGPDGRLYFTVGDRGYNVTTKEGKRFAGPGRGAVFRCESDGSGFEVVCTGLRNPQEIAFDDLGNLFTFDNTGDIGDLARLVYVLEGTDSGWNMAHQSPHHYRNHLDWGEFHPDTSFWVKEKMYLPHTEEQPQWIYPPASNVARGPSGVTWLTGESLPEDLRGKFLLANYRGPSVNCTVLTIGIEPKGAGYVANHEEVFAKGVGAGDVELGFDGNIYICDYGGGWSVNTNGAIHVLVPKASAQKEAGQAVAGWFKKGFRGQSIAQLVMHLKSPDKRLRQAAQLELASRGEASEPAFRMVALDPSSKLHPRLHALWGLGQLARRGIDTSGTLLILASSDDPEIRANAARILGDSSVPQAKGRLVEMLTDPSPRVRSLSAVALGRVANRGDIPVIQALYTMAGISNGGNEIDPVLRHAALSAIDRVGTVPMAIQQAKSPNKETRLLALLFLRRHADVSLSQFLDDPEKSIRMEAIRAIYDTAALDSPAGTYLANLPSDKVATYPETLQRRVVAANYRLGTQRCANNLVGLAATSGIAPSIREAALHALLLWGKRIVTDPVYGDYRPYLPNAAKPTDESLRAAISEPLLEFLAGEHPHKLQSLAIQLSTRTGIRLEPEILLGQISDKSLDADVRTAALESLFRNPPPGHGKILRTLFDDPEPSVQAAALRHAFAMKMGLEDVAVRKILKGPLPAAREAINGLSAVNPLLIAKFWKNALQVDPRPELRLDLYLAMQGSKYEPNQKAAAQFASSTPYAVQSLAVVGGDPGRGESVFKNQGACVQCHTVKDSGGIQGPELTTVGDRLNPEALIESLVNPGAVITPGYGNTVLTLKDGSTLAGRIAKEDERQLTLVALDGKETLVMKGNIQSTTPPVSAMPPMGLTLPPLDLRDLVAYLSALTTSEKK